MIKFRYVFLMVYCAAMALACNSTYTSKKEGYFKIDLPPAHSYVLFNEPGVPYQFEYPVYAAIVKDSTYFDSTPENPFWRNVDFPGLNARIFLSYKIIGGKAIYKYKIADGSYKDSSGINQFDKMVNDAFNLTNKNEAVASSINDSLFRTENGVTGIFFKVGGNAATPFQFLMSDTTRNFIRGALYFNTTPNVDSLKPVQDFLRVDINHMINTFRWKSE